ncbi:hypothetical protein K439DRAFT_590280 [Ramaria rubella]|nr:hypothetical protein K439DRAFT_590280 [Ramaria rubella]
MNNVCRGFDDSKAQQIDTIFREAARMSGVSSVGRRVATEATNLQTKKIRWFSMLVVGEISVDLVLQLV